MKKPAYPVVIEFSEEDRGYVARVPALKYCTAFGETYEEAAREIGTAIEGWMAVAEEKGTPIPAPGATIAELAEAADLLNVNEIARRIDVSPQTLYAKLRRGTELKPDESRKISRKLNDVGLHLSGLSPYPTRPRLRKSKA